VSRPETQSPRFTETLAKAHVRHFFRLKFKHIVEEQRKKSFFSRTFSRVGTVGGPPLTAIKRRLSTIVRADPNGTGIGNGDAENGIEREPKVVGDPSPPSSFEMEMQDKHRAGQRNRKQNLHPPGAGAVASPAVTPNPSPAPSVKKSKHKKKIDKNMIVRVGGGGVGMVNPMGWYDAEMATPVPSPKSSPKVIHRDTLTGQDHGPRQGSGAGFGQDFFSNSNSAGNGAGNGAGAGTGASQGGEGNTQTGNPLAMPPRKSSDKLVGILGLSVNASAREETRRDHERQMRDDETDSEHAIADSPDEMEPDE
jgi:hypothetical protein